MWVRVCGCAFGCEYARACMRVCGCVHARACARMRVRVTSASSTHTLTKASCIAPSACKGQEEFGLLLQSASEFLQFATRIGGSCPQTSHTPECACTHWRKPIAHSRDACTPVRLSVISWNRPLKSCVSTPSNVADSARTSQHTPKAHAQIDRDPSHSSTNRRQKGQEEMRTCTPVRLSVISWNRPLKSCSTPSNFAVSARNDLSFASSSSLARISS